MSQQGQEGLCGNRRFRIACFPGLDERNPYQRLFYEALAPYGVELLDEFALSTRWLHRQAPQLDGIHIHWPETLWRNYRPVWSTVRGYYRLRRLTHPISQLQALLVLGRYLRAARCLGIKRLWTVHNLEHHDGADWIDRLGYTLLARSSDLVICHSEEVALRLLRRYERVGQVVVVPIGTYKGVYPAPYERKRVLHELGLRDDLPMVCCVGALREYKGLDIAVEAIRALDSKVQLIIAGRPFPRFDITPLRVAAARVGHVVVRDQFVGEQEFSNIISAAEAVLLPYRQITGSSALLAAWTLGRGVIASDLPYFREIAAPDPDAARLFRPGDPAALAEAITEYLNVPLARRNAAVQRLAARYAWERCIAPLGKVIDSWRGGEGTV